MRGLLSMCAFYLVVASGCGDPDTASADVADSSADGDTSEVTVGLDLAATDIQDVDDSEGTDSQDDIGTVDVDVAPDLGPDEDTITIEDTTTPVDVSPPMDTVPSDSTSDVAEDDWDSNDPYAGLDSAALRARLLQETTEGHTPLGYTGARDAMYAVGGVDDVGGRIECIYTGRTVDATGSRTPNKNCARADGTPMSCSFNTEHTWARYYLDLALTENSAAYDAAEGDIHHLFPSDEVVNNARWHFDFGETDCLTDGNCKINEESRLGERPGIDGYSNCPTGNLTLGNVCLMRVRDARKGDVARGLFYMSVRYAMSMDDAQEAWLRAWNEADPPDDRERTRNDGAEAAQGNRNPFVDRPDLVQMITEF